MPGINRTGKPNTSDYWLGRGSLHLGSINPTTGKPIGFRHLGNLVGLSMGLESDTLEHVNSRSGIRQVDREISLSQKVNISITLDETSNFDNLALFMAGAAVKDADKTVGGNAARTDSATDVLLTTDAFKGLSYELVSAAGLRFYDLKNAVTVKSGASSAANTLVLGTDYEVDAKWGTIHLLSTSSTFVDGHSLYFSYTSAGTESTLDLVNMLTQSKISGFLRFKGINPANSDKQMLIDLHSVSLKADGEINWIGEDIAELTLTGVAEKNELGYPLSPVGRIYYHAGA